MKISGYTARDGKDKDGNITGKRYVNVFIINPIEEGAGFETVAVTADPSCEAVLKSSSFPLTAHVEQTMRNVQNQYGRTVTSVVISAILPQAKTS